MAQSSAGTCLQKKGEHRAISPSRRLIAGAIAPASLMPMFNSLSSMSPGAMDYDTTERPLMECESLVNTLIVGGMFEEMLVVTMCS
jgi:hypothetical protein